MHGTCSMDWLLTVVNKPARRQISPTQTPAILSKRCLIVSSPVSLASGNFPVRLKDFSILNLISSVACEDMHELPPDAALNRQHTDGHD